MSFRKQKIYLIFVALIAALALAGCGSVGAGDPTAPTVTSTIPADEAVDVATNTNITAAFSESMDPSTITETSFTLHQGTTAVTGIVTYNESTGTAKFNPAVHLATGTEYTATITIDAANPAGTSLATTKTWTFTTGATADTTAPTVTSTVAADGAVNVAIDADITATFSENMDGTTFTTASFTVAAGASTISGTVSHDAATKTASFNPASKLSAGVTYTATITTAVKDLADNALAGDKVWSFTTVAAADLSAGPDGGPDPVNLNSAGNYVILAKSAVSTTGTTAITGDVGLSPAGGTYLTGFSVTMDGSGEWSTSDYVTGKLYASDYVTPTPSELTTAISAMETAYTDAAGRSNPDESELGAGDISGLTLEPGLYKWGTGVQINTDVTLWGSSTATWIFQIAGDLTVANGVQVTLAGGALPENIVWQVGSNAAIGTTAAFAGTLMTGSDISLNTDASTNGRLLAQTAVTLDANAVTQP